MVVTKFLFESLCTPQTLNESYIYYMLTTKINLLHFLNYDRIKRAARLGKMVLEIIPRAIGDK